MKLLSALLILCAAPLPAAAESKNPLAITASVRGSREDPKNKGQRSGFAVFDGDTMKSGDQIEMQMSVNEAAYVYVVQFMADGTSAVLFPQECPTDKPKPAGGCGDVLAQANTPVRIPEKGDIFELDTSKGMEHIYFIASREPIAKADKAIAQAITDVRKSSAEPPKAAPPPKVAPPPPPKKHVDPAKTVDPTVLTKPKRTGAPPPSIVGAMLDATTRQIKRVKQADGQQATEGAASSVAAPFVVMHFALKHD